MLTERQIQILQAIIQLHTKLDQPIGSKTLLNETDIAYSSATIRNEMSQLEEKGYLEKTHTSSGRIPSLQGYRFYIDQLMKPSKISKTESKKIHQALGEEFRQIDDVIRHSADVLSQLTNYTAIVLGPESLSQRLTGFRIVPLTSRQMTALLATESGFVENLLFQLPPNVEAEDIEIMVRIIENELVGLPLMEVYNKLQNEIPLLIQKYARTAEGILQIVTDSMVQSDLDRVHVGGKMNFLDYTENIERSKIKSIFELIDHKNELANLLTTANRGINVKIGEELNNELFNEFSLVTGSYMVENYGKGIVAVLGPTSMSYEKTVGLLDSFRRELAEVLLQFYLPE